MPLSTYCFVLGVVELLLGIPMLVFPEATIRWYDRITKDDATIRVVGGIFLVLCVLVLIEDPAIGTDVPGLIRLLAWLVALKSLVLSWFPHWQARVRRPILSKRPLRILAGVAATGFGVLFLLAGTKLHAP